MSHEHGGGEEAIKKANIEAHRYNEEKRNRKLGKIVIEQEVIEGGNEETE